MRFTILKNGSVSAIQLTDGAGHAVLGDMAVKAVEKSGPFAPLPSESTEQSADLRMHFEYVPDTNPQMPSGATDQAATKMTVVPIRPGIVPPRMIFSSPPERTHDAGAVKCSGTVTLQLIVAEDGKAENVKVLRSLGPGLDQKAIEAVSKWKFDPATKDGKPVAVEITVEVDFHLNQ